MYVGINNYILHTHPNTSSRLALKCNLFHRAVTAADINKILRDACELSVAGEVTSVVATPGLCERSSSHLPEWNT